MKESEPPPTPPQNAPDPERRHPEGALDDPLHEWWQKNGRSIIAGAVLAVVATAVVFGFRAYRNAQEEAVQGAYNQAVAEGSLAAFARENAGHPLAGIAALKTGHQAFEEGDWSKARDLYALATESLEGNPLAGKARLGLGASHAKEGAPAEAARVFEAVATDESVFPAARAEAMFFLALLALSEDDRDGFEGWKSDLSEVDSMAVWQNKLDYYADRVPIPVVPEAELPGELREDEGESPPGTAPTAGGAAPVPPTIRMPAAPPAGEETAPPATGAIPTAPGEPPASAK